MSLKKNSKQIRKNNYTGKPFIATNPKYERIIKGMEIQVNIAKLNYGLKIPIDCSIHAKFFFHYPDTIVRKRKTGPPLTRKTKRVIDLSNLLQGIEDVLQDCGVILDDKLIESYDGSRRIYGSSRHLIEVELYPYEP